MRILFCCQLYAPSVGGVQEVVRQIAERLVLRGHEITVATTTMPERKLETLNGVRLVEFSVKGNAVEGMEGDVAGYQCFVVGGAFDAMLVYAAQQWTFDALWPVLDSIPFATVFVPCGFSNFYEPTYASYFAEMPAVMAKFGQMVFNATHYRDIDLARQHGLNNFCIVPNGACEDIFNVAVDPLFRERHAIPQDSFLFLNVGSFTGLKGQAELLQAFGRMQLPPGRHASLLLNGNVVRTLEGGALSRARKLVRVTRSRGMTFALTQVWNKLIRRKASPQQQANRINQACTDRRVVVSDFARAELTQAFLAADLFVFSSNFEYSPLVLFESAAAGTPFLSVSVGNSAEIAEWTGAGVLCPSSVDPMGYTRVSDEVLAVEMSALMNQQDLLERLGRTGRRNWAEKFTWEKIATQYEQLFNRLLKLAVDSEKND